MLELALLEHLDYDQTPKPIVYHYCSTHTLLSIVENSCIWLSDASKTNDKTEMQWIFSNVGKIFTLVLERYRGKYDEHLLQKVENVAHALIDSFLSKRAPFVQTRKDYLACFTENSDLLSQWRAYGNNGEGVAIGFDTKHLLFFQNKVQYEFAKVIYDQKITDGYIERSIDESLRHCLSDFISHTNIEIDYEIDNLYMDIGLLLAKVYDTGFFFKNPYFFEEQEWRLYRKISVANYTDSDGIDDYGYSEIYEGIFADNSKYLGDFTRSQLKFRANDTRIRSYFEIGFEQCKSNIIREIVLGPKCNIEPFDLKLLLLKNGYIEDVYSETITIKKSQAPYV